MKRLLSILLLAAFTAGAQQTLTNVFTGTTPNDGTGDSVPLAFRKLNTNDVFLETLIDAVQAQVDSMQSPTNGATAEFMTNSIQAIAGQYTNDLNANLLPLIYSRAATNAPDIWGAALRGVSLYNALRMQTDSSLYVTPSVYFTNVGGDLYLMHTNLGRVFAVSNGIVAANGALITNIPQAGVTGLPEALAWLTNNAVANPALVSTNDTRNFHWQSGRWNLTNATDTPILTWFTPTTAYRYQSPASDIIYRWDNTGPAWRPQVNISGGAGGSVKVYSAAGLERIFLNGAEGGGVTLGPDHPITFGESHYQIGGITDGLRYDSWSKHVFRYGAHGAEVDALTLEGANATLAGWIQASEFRGGLRRQDITNALDGTITNNTTGNAATVTAVTLAQITDLGNLTRSLDQITQSEATIGAFPVWNGVSWSPQGGNPSAGDFLVYGASSWLSTNSIHPGHIAGGGASSGMFMYWDGSEWAGVVPGLADIGASGTLGQFVKRWGDGFQAADINLGDIAQSSATPGQVPKWTGSAWSPQPDEDNDTLAGLGSTASVRDFPRWGGGGETGWTNSHRVFIEELDSGGAADANILVWSVGNGQWQPTALDLDYVAQSGAADGQVPKWNGSNWVPSNDNTGTSSEASTVTEDTTGPTQFTLWSGTIAEGTIVTVDAVIHGVGIMEGVTNICANRFVYTWKREVGGDASVVGTAVNHTPTQGDGFYFYRDISQDTSGADTIRIRVAPSLADADTAVRFQAKVEVMTMSIP